MNDDSEYIHAENHGQTASGEWRPLIDPTDKRQLYSNVRGISDPQPMEEKPRTPRRLPLSVRRCCAHAGDEEYTGLFEEV
jgi:hypothetical protein